METLRERVLEFIRATPGLDDDQIAARLAVSPRQSINQCCRRLAEANLIRRPLGPNGKIVNIATSQAPRLARIASQEALAIAETVMHEEAVVAALVRWLRSEGWQIDRIAGLSERGADIRASRGQERRVIECKGSGSSHPMRNNYFTGVLGQILQRMDGEVATYSLGLPDISKFRRLWAELHGPLKAQLGLTALFVSLDGQTIDEVD